MNRLGLLDPNRFEYVENGSFTVVEQDEGGHATIEFVVPPQTTVLRLNLQGARLFPILAARKHADGHFLLYRDGQWEAHVAECKRTLGMEALRKAVEQVHGSVARVEMIARFLGVEITRWHAWLAFRKEVVSAPTTNPAVLKNLDLMKLQRHWLGGELPGPEHLVSVVPVRRIQLDTESGRAIQNLA